MKVLIIAEILRGSFSTDTLPPRQDLFNSLRTFHNEKAEAITTEFKVSEKYRWMKWMPSLGVAYNLQGEPRPALSFSLSQVYQNLNDKETKKAKIVQILRGASSDFKQDSVTLEMTIRKVEILRGSIPYLQAVATVDDQLWELTKRKHTEKDISDVEYLTALKLQTERAANYRQFIEQIEIEELNVLKLARF
jgi:hypothetical protein